MQKVLVPVFNNRISARLDCATNFELLKCSNKKVLSKEVFKIIASNHVEKINWIYLVNPDVLICNGLPEYYNTELIKKNIKIIPWIHGTVDNIIEKYFRNSIN